MWDKPVPVKQLVLAPAERADMLVDFSKFAGQTLVMKNHKPPKPVATPAPQLPQVMQIRVGTTVSQPGPGTIPTSLPGRAADLHDPVATRYITLNEIDADEPTWFLNLNGLHFGARPADHFNRNAEGRDGRGLGLHQPDRGHPSDAHAPGHLPGDRADTVRCRGLRGRQWRAERGARWDRPEPVRDGADGAAPTRAERGFKDTVKANPGYFTTIRAKFELPSGVTAPQSYVYHCHIVEHEDNDMMRPFTVTA